MNIKNLCRRDLQDMATKTYNATIFKGFCNVVFCWPSKIRIQIEKGLNPIV